MKRIIIFCGMALTSLVTLSGCGDAGSNSTLFEQTGLEDSAPRYRCSEDYHDNGLVVTLFGNANGVDRVRLEEITPTSVSVLADYTSFRQDRRASADARVFFDPHVADTGYNITVENLRSTARQHSRASVRASVAEISFSGSTSLGKFSCAAL